MVTGLQSLGGLYRFKTGMYVVVSKSMSSEMNPRLRMDFFTALSNFARRRRFRSAFSIYLVMVLSLSITERRMNMSSSTVYMKTGRCGVS